MITLSSNTTTSSGDTITITGYPQVLLSGTQYIVCRANLLHSRVQSAKVMCSELGYETGSLTNNYNYYYNYYKITNLNCYGNETALLDCQYQTSTGYSYCYRELIQCSKSKHNLFVYIYNIKLMPALYVYLSILYSLSDLSCIFPIHNIMLCYKYSFHNRNHTSCTRSQVY